VKTTWRFIDSQKLSAKENMELDKSLYDNFDSKAIFRLYSWKENSFSIGRFQKIDELEKFGSDYAKRITGGGLLMHGFDISYSIIASADLFDKKSVKQSYEYLCSFLIHFYKDLGLDVEFAKDTKQELSSESLFCQKGFEPYDIVCQGKKIGGNAQRRSRDIIFQHGSIPLRDDKREFSGYSLQEFGIDLDEERAKELLKKSFINRFGVEFA
jgi:lipoate-protein ligase A